ncbi:29440_t:CDS:2 [Gigaspora margarita]|uniref:29440_t:CDS:1 n=1 Tax=Gigaspora margarita TaxID=4874 RepID=A0ABN7VVC0_GIGMA|nr:29440_t:CDS:2 [Gigaspora margarita]
MPPLFAENKDYGPLPPKEQGNPDYRQPLYIGEWKKSIPYVDEDIAADDLDEPHMKRKVTILKSHPEIEKLYGYDISTVPIVIVAAAAQIVASYVFGRILTDWNWTMFIYCYFIGASLTQLYGVIIHEATHCLAAPTRFQNRIVGLLANLALPFPIAMSFRRYHLEHHTFQGVVGMDPDLPMEWEWKMIRGNAFLKFIWLSIYPAMYVARGVIMQKTPQFWEGFLYLVLSLWLGYGVHPAAAHFIQEHYTFDDAEYYDSLAYHTSWVLVHWNFVTQKQFGPQSRVGRTVDDHKKGRKMLGKLKKELLDE